MVAPGIADLAYLRQAARNAVNDHKRVEERVAGAIEDPERRARLAGPFPHWAAYVLRLGEPAPSAITRARAEQLLGSAANMRVMALRLLEIADEIDPVITP